MPDVTLLYGHTTTSACGIPLRVGQTMTFMANPIPAEGSNPAGFSTSACMMSGLSLGPAPTWPAGYAAQQEQAAQSASMGWRLLQTFRAERERLDALIAVSPGALEPVLERARLLETWRDTGALGAYAELASRAPDLLPAQLGLVRSLLREKRPDEAKGHLDRALALAPGDAGVRQTVAYARALAGDEAVLQEMRNFRGLDLRPVRRRITLSTRNLRGADFSDARFGFLDLSGADLRGVRFTGALVGLLRLSGADLRGADLAGLSVQELTLDKARLDGTNIVGIDLSRHDLREASLRGVIGPDARLGGARLSGADLSGASLPGANLSRALLVNARFENARLVGANLYRSDLSGADLSRADIRGAAFDEAFFDCRTRLPRGITPQSLGMFAADPSAPRCQ
ncbi:pentapeptide repeat-containing protein [Pararoseomonas indoligenes]|uniref:Pentapeptide repeat-containing protein n=1 Tax=Roseomonas indoligenes TaxID=2820811 RepID=A0A940S8K7_9PROT|nr:pentapeptide repeat-containing protein [Pararoseomonas indoligenes]